MLRLRTLAESHPDPKVAAFIEHFAALMKELIWPSCTGPLDLGALRAAMAKLPYKQTQRKRECNPFTEQFGGTTEEDVCEYISTLFDALEVRMSPLHSTPLPLHTLYLFRNLCLSSRMNSRT